MKRLFQALHYSEWTVTPASILVRGKNQTNHSVGNNDFCECIVFPYKERICELKEIWKRRYNYCLQLSIHQVYGIYGAGLKLNLG